MTRTTLIGAAVATALAAGTLAPANAATQATAPAAARTLAADSSAVRHKTVEVDGVKIFYREAGDPAKPVILLLHGFPSSSHMYRDLIPQLASDFYLIAPDYPGFGYSDAPSASKFAPTFENLAKVMAGFVQAVGLRRFTMYMQDFGGPVGLRMAVEHPDWVDGLIIQNANAYLEGVEPKLLQGMKERGIAPLTAAQRAEVEHIVSPEMALFFYQAGARSFATMSRDGYMVDSWMLGNPEGRRIQSALIVDYASNLQHYPRWQAYLRKHQPKTLIAWGKNDPLFLPPGAQAYLRDLPRAELNFFDTGHFALEEDAAPIAALIRSAFKGASPAGER